MQRTWPTYLLAALTTVAFPALATGAGQNPAASFSFSPENARAGDQVRFESSSCDPDGRLVRQAWDLDGDGSFDEAEGAVATGSFLESGVHRVGLQVTSADGATSVARHTVIVNTEYALPRPDSARLMTPFPIVTLAGRVTAEGSRIRLLAIRAPVCSRVQVTCGGRGCPARRVSAYAGRRQLRVHRLERRLRAGTLLTVRVYKGRLIGKFTTFRIREGKSPARRDMCLRPGESAGSRCPRD
jgi:PKD domain-containing protein